MPAGEITAAPIPNTTSLAVGSAPATLPDQNNQHPVQPVSAQPSSAPPPPAPPPATHDPAVVIAPSVAAATVGLQSGDDLVALVIAADQDGRPVLQTDDGVFIADTPKTYPPGTQLNIQVANVGQQVTVAVTAENGQPLPQPAKLDLILVQLPPAQPNVPAAPLPSPASPGTSSPLPPTYRPQPTIPAGAVQTFIADGESLSILTSAPRWTPTAFTDPAPAAPSLTQTAATAPSLAPPPTSAGRAPSGLLDLRGIVTNEAAPAGTQSPARLTPALQQPATDKTITLPDLPESDLPQTEALHPGKPHAGPAPGATKSAPQIAPGRLFAARLIPTPASMAALPQVGSGSAELARLGKLPAGQELQLVFQPRPQAQAVEIAAAPRGTAAAYARPAAAPSASAETPRNFTVSGTIIELPATEPGGPPLRALATPLGVLAAPEFADLPQGAVVTVGARLVDSKPAETKAPPPAATPAEPKGETQSAPAVPQRPLPDRLMEHWPAMAQIAAVLQQHAPELAAQLGERLPGVGPRLAKNLAYYFFTARGGGDWLGAVAGDALGAAGRTGLADHLRAELARPGAPATGDWQSLALPFDTGEAVIALPMLIRPFDAGAERDADGKWTPGGKGARFLLDLNLSRLGAMQIDGMAQAKKLDIILRAGQALPQDLRQGLSAAYYAALAGQGMTGSLSIRTETALRPAAAAAGLAPALKI